MSKKFPWREPFVIGFSRYAVEDKKLDVGIGLDGLHPATGHRDQHLATRLTNKDGSLVLLVEGREDHPFKTIQVARPAIFRASRLLGAGQIKACDSSPGVGSRTTVYPRDRMKPASISTKLSSG